MPQWLEWTLIALAGVAALYVLFFIVVVFIIYKFNKRLTKRREALRLLLAQRKDITLSLFQLASKEKIAITTAVRLKMSELSNKEIGLLNDHEIIEYSPTLEKIAKLVTDMIDGHKSLKKSEEYAQFKKELIELDEIKRQHIAIYNSDVNGYNYWIRLKSYRRILLALNFSEKKRLE